MCEYPQISQSFSLPEVVYLLNMPAICFYPSSPVKKHVVLPSLFQLFYPKDCSKCPPILAQHQAQALKVKRERQVEEKKCVLREQKKNPEILKF